MICEGRFEGFRDEDSVPPELQTLVIQCAACPLCPFVQHQTAGPADSEGTLFTFCATERRVLSVPTERRPSIAQLLDLDLLQPSLMRHASVRDAYKARGRDIANVESASSPSIRPQFRGVGAALPDRFATRLLWP